MPKYPAQIDTTLSLPTAVDNLTPVQGKIFNKLRDAVLSIESELGVKPSATYSTVKARIDALEGIVGNLQIIELDKDLGGSLEAPLVIGIQGRPVSTVPPQPGEVYVWDGIAWIPQPQSGGGSGGGITPGGDLAGGPFIQTVIGLQNRPINSTAPSKYQALVWSGVAWQAGFVPQDLITPPLEFTFVSNTQFAEVNQNIITPSFTATYEITPSLALLTDDLHPIPKDVTSTPTAFSSNFNFIKTAFGNTVEFTLTATQDFVTKIETQTIAWGQKLYWGLGPAGSTGQAFIKALPGQQITLTKQLAFSVNAGLTDKIYFSCRTAYGDVTFKVHDIEGGFTKTQTVPLLNDFGFTENYDLYESDNVNLGTLIIITGDGNEEIGPQGPTGPSGPPSGLAGGDLYGTYQNHIVNQSMSSFFLIGGSEIRFTGGVDDYLLPLPATNSLRDGYQTTDGTANQIMNTVTPPDGYMIRVVSEISAIRTDVAGDAAWFLVKGVWLRSGGSLIAIKAPEVIDTGATAGASTWAATLAAVGSAVQTQVTGQAGKTIHWSTVREWVEAI